MERARTSSSRGGWRTYLNPSSLPFWGIHVAAVVGVALLGWSWSGVLLATLLYAIRMVFVTAGYHRYFSHRSFKTSRTFQFVLGFLAQTAMQRGVLWWAAHHRHHHRHSDTDNDVHSPARHGFWWAHLGWSASPTSSRFGADQVKDLARYPELRMLDRCKHAPGILLALALFLVGGAHALVWGFLVSTVLLWHGTFTINSLSHVIGRRRYPTRDDSRNNWVLALITMGEGWHNNHHHYQGSARQGFFWWEIDVSFYILYCLEVIGVVWDLRRPPRRILAGAARQAPAHALKAAVQIPGPMPLAPILGHEAE